MILGSFSHEYYGESSRCFKGLISFCQIPETGLHDEYDDLYHLFDPLLILRYCLLLLHVCFLLSINKEAMGSFLTRFSKFHKRCWVLITYQSPEP